MINAYNSCNEHEDNRILLNCFECIKSVLKPKNPAEYLKHAKKLENDPYIIESTISLVNDLDEQLDNAFKELKERMLTGLKRLPDSEKKREFLKKYYIENSGNIFNK